MAKNKESKLIMLEHSKAKVELFGRYLSIYLNVISRVPFIKKIYLYDLFAGEGKYLNNEKGSPIVAMDCIKNHYYSNNETCPTIDILFNDSRKSEIDPKIYKIERVRMFVDEMFKPQNVTVRYKKEEYNEIIKEVILQLGKIPDSERALLFIDPW
jgi:three-Cys-motif partner protein